MDQPTESIDANDCAITPVPSESAIRSVPAGGTVSFLPLSVLPCGMDVRIVDAASASLVLVSSGLHFDVSEAYPYDKVPLNNINGLKKYAKVFYPYPQYRGGFHFNNVVRGCQNFSIYPKSDMETVWDYNYQAIEWY